MESYLLLAIELKGEHYTRTALAGITRELNKLFAMPALILFRHGDTLTLAIINRRLNKRDESRDVLEKVTVIKNIAISRPHRAHVEILFDLALPSLLAKYRCKQFADMHAAWRQVLDIEALNKQFYDRIAEWFFFAAQKARFPHGGIDNEDVRNRTGLIRLLTRVVFCWFAKEKNLIPERLFDEETARDVLKNFDTNSLEVGSYYKAILQNLFFPTLSVPINEREFRDCRRYHGRNDDYMKHDVFRYKALFKKPEELGRLFADIPFLNGGLFECLDYREKENGKWSEVRVDGFSDVPENQPLVANALFFGHDMPADLGEARGSTKKACVIIDGLFHILNAYKFTVAENTPIEEEIALDPELLGRIFENLLAEYNPDTRTTARKETGSFYTPRTIVNYMVDTSLGAYLLKQLQSKHKELSTTEATARIQDLLAYSEAAPEITKPQAETIADAIYDITILDPACGSGAFPMGVLQKLIFILGKLDNDHQRWKTRVLNDTPAALRAETRELLTRSTAEYTWKLALIQHAIYGVDIQPIAVQISKLRCFISLLVDFEVDVDAENLGVPPLPNLDFKFVAADTLVRPPGTYRDDELALEDPFFAKFAKTAEAYFFVKNPPDKKQLREDIESLIDGKIAEKEAELVRHRGDDIKSTTIRNSLLSNNKATIANVEREIVLWESYRNIFAFRNKYVRFFDIKHFFPEIKNRFHIVIGNPPYMRIQGIREQDPAAADYYQASYKSGTGSFDLCVIFAERGLELLGPGGVLNYIMPDKWVHAGGGEGLRRLVSDGHRLNRLISLGSHKVFSASTYSSLLWLTNERNPAVRYARFDPPKNAPVDLDLELGSLTEGRFATIDYATLTHEPWVLAGDESASVLTALLVHKRRLGHVFENMFQGIASSKDSVYFLRDAEDQGNLIEAYSPELDCRVQIEKNLVKPLLMGDQVHRYDTLSTTNVVVFPYELPSDPDGKAKLMTLQEIKKFKKGWEYLKKCQDVLRSRERNRFDNEEWYQFGRKQGIGHGNIPKLLAPDISLGGNFAYDAKGDFFTTTTVYGYIKNANVWESYEYWLALLNSTILWFYLKNTGSVLANGYYRYKPAYLEAFPVPQCSPQQESVITQLALYRQFVKTAGNDATADIRSRSDMFGAFLEEVIDACVMETYFADHMWAKDLCVITAAAIATPFPDHASASTRWNHVQAFYNQANAPKHPIRNRLMRLTIDSPDLLRVIKNASKN
jgi:adenine-specific DNA-methyltransferase